MKCCSFFIVMLIMVSLPFPAISAEVVTEKAVVNMAGGTSSTSGHTNMSSVGELIIGQSNAEAVIQAGFFNDFVLPIPTVTPTATPSPTVTVTPTGIRQFGGEVTTHARVFAAPNPIRGTEGKIYFDLAMPADVEIKIYTPHNQLVLSRNFDNMPAGQNLWRWQINGNQANGVYLLRLKARNSEGKISVVLRKIILIK